jgi:hypothetical protein
MDELLAEAENFQAEKKPKPKRDYFKAAAESVGQVLGKVDDAQVEKPVDSGWIPVKKAEELRKPAPKKAPPTEPARGDGIAQTGPGEDMPSGDERADAPAGTKNRFRGKIELVGPDKARVRNEEDAGPGSTSVYRAAIEKEEPTPSAESIDAGGEAAAEFEGESYWGDEATENATQTAESDETIGDAVLTEEEKAAEAAAADEPDYEDMFFSAQAAMANEKYARAAEIFSALLQYDDLPAEIREQSLYSRADCLFQLHADKHADNFDLINGAYAEAMNYNLDSYSLPSALLRRGILNLRVGNIPETTAFFNLLRKKYEYDPNVPLTYYYWGEHYYEKGDYKNAADEFQYMVQVYPESKFIREASVSLAKSLKKLGYHDQAHQIVDFIEKRWPRFYIEYPPFLALAGDAAYALKDYDRAKEMYWTYYNIDPDGDEADVMLARLGDTYVKTSKFPAAKELYEKAVAKFPDATGGLVSKMRLAEEGVYDEPSLDEMFSVFDRPYNLRPYETYKHIVEDYPGNELAPLAQLKLAMWQLFHNKYMDALASVDDLKSKFPESDLNERGSKVGMAAFEKMSGQLAGEESFQQIVDLYNKHDYVRDNWEKLSPETQLAVGLGFWKSGKSDQALRTVTPLLKGDQVPKYSENALSLALGIYVDDKRWDKVIETAELVEEWDLSPDYGRELAYAVALAHENMDDHEASSRMWAGLAGDRKLDSLRRAYAMYFLAQEAVAKEDLKDAYDYGQEALALLLETGEDKAKIRDSLRILMDVAERAGRPADALKWATQYKEYMKEDDPAADALHYRLAGLYKKTRNIDKWRGMLEELQQGSPDGLYGRMAASDLKSYALEEAARKYQPAEY